MSVHECTHEYVIQEVFTHWKILYGNQFHVKCDLCKPLLKQAMCSEKLLYAYIVETTCESPACSRTHAHTYTFCMLLHRRNGKEAKLEILLM